MGPGRSEALAQTARRVVGEAREVLLDSQRGGARVDAVFHYGAVDIDPHYLVVWILLAGKDDDQLPEWLKIEPEPAQQPDACQIDYQWLLELRTEIVRRFADANWPAPEAIAVYVDSSHRVTTHGGWHYFK